MNLVRALLACVHLLQCSAYEKLAAWWDSCLICVSVLTTGLTQPVRNLVISVKALCVLYWKVAFTIYSVAWRFWNFIHTWCTASCCMLSRLPRLLPGIPYAALSLLCCICSQMQEAALHLLWMWTPGEIHTICTALAHSWCSTGTKGSDPVPPSRASFAFGSFSISRTIRRALNCCWNSLLRSPLRACLALLCQICGQLKEAALHLLQSWTPGWILITSTSLAQFWYSTIKEDSAGAPPRRACFAFGSFVTSRIIRTALKCCWTLLQGASPACLALLCHVCSQLQEAALQMLWSCTPGWIHTTCAIIVFLWHNTGKRDPAAAPPGTASFPFGDFIVTVVRRARTCSSGISPSSSGTVGASGEATGMHPAPARDMSGQDKSGMREPQYAGSDGCQDPAEATKVGFFNLSSAASTGHRPAGVCLAALMLLSCLLTTLMLLRICDILC